MCLKPVMAQIQAASLLLTTHQLCKGVGVLVFAVKRSSACYPNCHRVLSVATGVCSGRGGNDRQATWVTPFENMPLTQNC